MIPAVGQIFEMRLDNFPNMVMTFGVLDIDVKDDSHGTIKLEKLKSKRIYTNHEEVKDFKKGKTITVEEQWFTANDKRKIKLL